MKAMVLAAGKGERLRPLTDNLPKPLIPIEGKPLISHTLDYLSNCGIREVVINLHYLGEQIQDYLGTGSRWNLRVHYSWEPSILGTGGGIHKAAPHLIDDTFVVINADILIELDLKRVIAYHREKEALATLVLRDDPDVEKFGVIEMDVYGFVKQILGKPHVPKSPRKKLMFTGLHILEPAVFSYMPNQKSFFSIIDTYLNMLASGERLMGYEMKGFWSDLGTHDRYEEVQRLLQEGEISLSRLVQECR